MVEKTLPTSGPMMVTAAITTTATSTRISAYSTMPCPFSLRASFMIIISLLTNGTSKWMYLSLMVTFYQKFRIFQQTKTLGEGLIHLTEMKGFVVYSLLKETITHVTDQYAGGQPGFWRAAAPRKDKPANRTRRMAGPAGP